MDSELMKRVILDTNIYGEIIERDDIDLVLNNISKSNLVIYGCDIITKELRKISKEKVTISAGKKKKLRSIILSVYHSLAKKDLAITQEIMEIADLFYITYIKLGGSISREKIFSDFIIVALASKNGLDIVYSSDNQTMMSYLSMRTYDVVNTIRKLKTPNFKNYGEFKNEIK